MELLSTNNRQPERTINTFSLTPRLGYKKGEGRFSFTSLRREISPATHSAANRYFFEKYQCSVKVKNFANEKFDNAAKIYAHKKHMSDKSQKPKDQICILAFLASSSSTVSRYISSGMQQSTGQTDAH